MFLIVGCRIFTTIFRKQNLMLGNFQASTTVAAMVPPHVMKAATVSRRAMRATAVGEAVDPMGGLLGF